MTTNPKLQDVMRPTISAGEKVSDDEYRFVVQTIHHVVVSYQLAQMDGINPAEGVRRDVHNTMNLPVFRAVWERNKAYQDTDFVNFIDSCIAGIDLDKPLGKKPNLIQRTAKKARSGLSIIHPKRQHITESRSALEQNTTGQRLPARLSINTEGKQTCPLRARSDGKSRRFTVNHGQAGTLLMTCGSQG